MKNQFVFGFVAALCILAVSADDETAEQPSPCTLSVKEKICEPGTLSKVNCNTCICNQEGTELACTRKMCVPGMNEEEVVPQNLPIPENMEVTKTDNVDTADVKNAENAENKVEMKTEDQIPVVAKDRRRRDAADTCVPGEMFKMDCNDCFCPSSGRKSEASQCTLIAC